MVSLNTWRSIRFTFDATHTTRLYIDGTLVKTTTLAPNYSRTTNWALTMGNFDGDIDEVAISKCVSQACP